MSWGISLHLRQIYIEKMTKQQKNLSRYDVFRPVFNQLILCWKAQFLEIIFSPRFLPNIIRKCEVRDILTSDSRNYINIKILTQGNFFNIYSCVWKLILNYILKALSLLYDWIHFPEFKARCFDFHEVIKSLTSLLIKTADEGQCLMCMERYLGNVL